MKVGWWQLVSFNDREAANYKVTDLLASVTKGGRLDLHNSFLPFLSPTPSFPPSSGSSHCPHGLLISEGQSKKKFLSRTEPSVEGRSIGYGGIQREIGRAECKPRIANLVALTNPRYLHRDSIFFSFQLKPPAVLKIDDHELHHS